MSSSNEPTCFELNLWNLHNTPKNVREWFQACWRHDISSLEEKYQTNWQDFVLDKRQKPLVNPLHLFACGYPRSGGLYHSRQILNWILQRGGSLKEQDAYGWLPINYAAWFGLASTIDLLLEAGSPVQNNNIQPLDSALFALSQKDQPGSETCARLLLMHGANPKLGNVSDPHFAGLTWLVWALENHRWDWAECLWNRGCSDISEKEIHLLLFRGSIESLCWLQEKDVNILSFITSNHEAFDDLMQIKASKDRERIIKEITESCTDKFSNKKINKDENEGDTESGDDESGRGGAKSLQEGKLRKL